MKIRLSKEEIYEIKMPEEIQIQEFAGIVAKFNFLLKNFTKFNIGADSTNIYDKEAIVLNPDLTHQYKKQDKKRWLFLKENRKALIEILKGHYTQSKEEWEAVIAKYGLDFKKADMGGAQMVRVREMHNIKPEEVGLKAWWHRGDNWQELKAGNKK